MSGRSSEQSKRGPRSKRAEEPYQFTDESATVSLLALAIGAALKGGALRIGLTRDMGALAIGVYQGEEYGTEYIRPNENLEQELRQISMAWEVPFAVWDQEADCWKLP